jgi:anti-sigma B factor antagonist
MDPQLTLTVHQDGHGTVLGVDGEVDLATAPQLQAKLMDLVNEGTDGGVVVDLTRVAFMDSTGIRVLLAAHQRAPARGVTIRLVCPEGPVLRVVRLTGAERVLPTYRSLVEAVGAQPSDAAAG